VKIVYLHQYFVTPDMPGITRSYEFGRRLAERGHEVHMVAGDGQADAGAPAWKEEEVAGMQVHWAAVPYRQEMSFRTRIRSFFAFAWRAAVRARAIGGDVVFATSTPLTIAIPGIYAARRNRIPMVLEIRDLWPEAPIAMGALRNPVSRGLAHGLERAAYRSAEHIVTLSPGMRDGVLRTGVAPRRVSVIPNSCDMELFDVPAARGASIRAAHPWLGDRPMLLYAGTVGRVNGLEYMVDMAAALRDRDPEVRFVVLGRGNRLEAVRDRARNLGVLDETFFMLDPVPKREVGAWYAAATLASSFVVDLPEMEVNSANKFFDSLASGTPVVINHAGWQAELLEESGAGLPLPAGRPDEGAALLGERIRDGAWLARASESARALAAGPFCRDSLAADLEQILLAVVEGRRIGPLAPDHPALNGRIATAGGAG
jgi:glycosyltransferase involved in cell wall biosynthesis